MECRIIPWREGYFSQRAEASHLFLVRVFSLLAGRLRNVQTASHTWLSETGTCEIHLTCFVENSKDTFIRWQVVGNTSVNEANLSISWDSRNSGEQEFTCIAENPVSNISLSVSTQRLCEGNSLSLVPLGALSSCGVGCVPPAQGDSPEQWPRGRQPNTVRRVQTLLQALCLSPPPEASPSSLPPQPHLQLSQSSGARSLGSQNCSPLWL